MLSADVPPLTDALLSPQCRPLLDQIFDTFLVRNPNGTHTGAVHNATKVAKSLAEIRTTDVFRKIICCLQLQISQYVTSRPGFVTLLVSRLRSSGVIDFINALLMNNLDKFSNPCTQVCMFVLMYQTNIVL